MITVRSISARPVRGSVSCGNSVQHLGHLVAALAAADVDDDVGVAPLGQRLLQHRLAGAEAAGDGRAAAARDREQRVEDALAGDQRLVGRQALRHRARPAHRPALEQRHRCSRPAPSRTTAMRRVGAELAARRELDDVRRSMPGGTRHWFAGPAPSTSPSARARRDGGADRGLAARTRSAPACCRCVAAVAVQAAQQAVVDLAQPGPARAAPTAAARCRAPGRRASGRWCPRRPARRTRCRRGG